MLDRSLLEQLYPRKFRHSLLLELLDRWSLFGSEPNQVRLSASAKENSYGPDNLLSAMRLRGLSSQAKNSGYDECVNYSHEQRLWDLSPRSAAFLRPNFSSILSLVAIRLKKYAVRSSGRCGGDIQEF